MNAFTSEHVINRLNTDMPTFMKLSIKDKKDTNLKKSKMQNNLFKNMKYFGYVFNRYDTHFRPLNHRFQPLNHCFRLP